MKASSMRIGSSACCVRDAVIGLPISAVMTWAASSSRRSITARSRATDRLDGGRVVAIGEGQLRYQKKGRNEVLAMPSG
ncbi:hypothetical protein [Mangrovicoccus ximenensis]|uniref:hypothetical protein n=1 Tax=Mangrovicoccus ximenensis TaxID=1911570 RepID=UPI001F44850A|nr:hypothetical protein [Mangrovicoccus ximenensis]